MLLPLKQHSVKKLYNISIYFRNTVQTCLKIFPITRFLGQLLGKHRGVILKCLQLSQEAKKSKRPLDISNGTRRSCLGEKTEYKKSRETAPLIYSMCSWHIRDSWPAVMSVRRCRTTDSRPFLRSLVICCQPKSMTA